MEGSEGKSTGADPDGEPKPPAEPAAQPKPAASGGGGPADKDPSRDVWFRVSTRVRAAGYWLREQDQRALRGLGAAGERAVVFWGKRSLGERIGVGAAAGLVLVALLIRIVPVPGVPCQISVAECAPEQRSFDLVPADALLYAHVTLDRDSEQFEKADEVADALPDLRAILSAELPAALPAPSGERVDVNRDVLPWAERDLAVTLLPGAGKRSLRAYIVGVSDRAGADEFIAGIAPRGQATPEAQGDTELSVYPGGFATAFTGDDQLVFGDERAVRDALRAQENEATALSSERTADSLYEELPEARFAELYMSRSGVQRLLSGRPGPASQLESFVDYGATQGIVVAAVAEDDGVELQLVSELNSRLLAKSPSFFSGLPRFEPELDGEAGADSIGYLGVGEVGPTLSDLLERARGAAGPLRRLSARLRGEAGVDPLSELLPALGGEAALVAEPTEGAPVASLIVDGVDEERAAQALARLQRPLLRALGTSGGARVLRFEESEVEGIDVRSVRVSPTVNLSYAIFDGKLVVSTDPAGIAGVRSSGEGLDGSEGYERATEALPDEVSALVFLNLDELFGQVTRTDLVEDPFFANLSVLFDNAASMALAVSGTDEMISTQIFLALDD